MQLQCTHTSYICTMVKIFEAKIGNYLDDTHRSVFFTCTEWDQVILEDVEKTIQKHLEKSVPGMRSDYLHPYPEEYVISINEISFIDMSSDKSCALVVNESVPCYTHIDIP